MEVEQKIEILKETELFKRLSDEHIMFLAHQMSTLNVAAGEKLVHEGQTADAFFLIVEGSVSLKTTLDGGESFSVQSVGPDGVIGWSWLVPPFTWHYDAVADSPAIVYRFDGKAIRAECGQDPAFGYAVMRSTSALMLERLNHVRGHMTMRIAELEREVASLKGREPS